jgi:hypothetical protein
MITTPDFDKTQDKYLPDQSETATNNVSFQKVLSDKIFL